MQNFESTEWKKRNGQTMLVTDLSLIETLEAIWAVYCLASKHSKYVSYLFSPLGNALFNHLRSYQSELTFQETDRMLVTVNHPKKEKS